VCLHFNPCMSNMRDCSIISRRHNLLIHVAQHLVSIPDKLIKAFGFNINSPHPTLPQAGMRHLISPELAGRYIWMQCGNGVVVACTCLTFCRSPCASDRAGSLGKSCLHQRLQGSLGRFCIPHDTSDNFLQCDHSSIILYQGGR